MPFVRLESTDRDGVRAAADILEAARAVDDPDAFPILAEFLTSDIAYGWDMEPDDHYLYLPDDSAEPVGVLQVGLPLRDNLHLATVDVIVHPDHRHRDGRETDHRAVIMDEAIRLAAAAGRTVLWLWTPVDDQGSADFLAGFGFVKANQDARRHQHLAEVDAEVVDQHWAVATAAAADYELVRMVPPLDDDLLTELLEVTAAINDAPMGELTYENEVFDLDRLRDHQRAGVLRGERRYRIAARHRRTGVVGGHTEVMVHPRQPRLAHQADTAVARDHRGHRLGLLLKIDMMRWLAEAEPQLEIIETFNNAANDFMIKVNEALGYRLSRIFTTYQLDLQTVGLVTSV